MSTSSTSDPSSSSNASRRKTSMKRKTSETSEEKIVANNGDIYTKVAMPRSKSFMKMNNNQISPQYNLQDLFKELKEQVSFFSKTRHFKTLNFHA